MRAGGMANAEREERCQQQDRAEEDETSWTAPHNGGTA
jgi:hypothetical protein